ncbi:MAG: M23 family metallopeptidase [Deltaproteobacteria bacterium]|nr:M23 family metallopeptidase [Deltaproteobacteria bacterium]
MSRCSPWVGPRRLAHCWMTSCALGCAAAPTAAKAPAEAAEDSAAPPADTAEDSAAEVLPPRGPVALAWPLLDPAAFGSTLYVDHDPEVQEDTPLGRTRCLDHAGRAFPYCYDEHDGTDYILVGGFSAMDAGSQPVVAAAAGQVVSAEDGHYDRCRASAETGDVDCDGHPIIANHVILEHVGEDGARYRTLYWHLAQGSVQVRVGDEVEALRPLGLVGSSGYSSMPHLHFELQDVDELVLDPYAGAHSQPESWWCAQGALDEAPGPCD